MIGQQKIKKKKKERLRNTEINEARTCPPRGDNLIEESVVQITN